MNASYHQAVAVLKKFLDAPERKDVSLDIDRALGAMVATLSSPEYVSEVELGFLILGDDPSGEEEWFAEGEIRNAWVSCLNTLGEALYDETYSVEELYSLDKAYGRPPEPFSRWCDGYLQGYLLTEAAWQDGLDFLSTQNCEDIVTEHEYFLSALASFTDWDTALADNNDPEKLKGGFQLLAKAISNAVTHYHNLALVLEENRMRDSEEQEPFVREEEKVGRNDPCPCGSGKKHKKCCLH